MDVKHAEPLFGEDRLTIAVRINKSPERRNAPTCHIFQIQEGSNHFQNVSDDSKNAANWTDLKYWMDRTNTALWLYETRFICALSHLQYSQCLQQSCQKSRKNYYTKENIGADEVLFPKNLTHSGDLYDSFAISKFTWAYNFQYEAWKISAITVKK